MISLCCLNHAQKQQAQQCLPRLLGVVVAVLVRGLWPRVGRAPSSNRRAKKRRERETKTHARAARNIGARFDSHASSLPRLVPPPQRNNTTTPGEQERDRGRSSVCTDRLPARHYSSGLPSRARVCTTCVRESCAPPAVDSTAVGWMTAGVHHRRMFELCMLLPNTQTLDPHQTPHCRQPGSSLSQRLGYAVLLRKGLNTPSRQTPACGWAWCKTSSSATPTQHTHRDRTQAAAPP